MPRGPLRKASTGNILGEGFILGGVFVMGRGQQGILPEHRHRESGDKVNNGDVIRAARIMSSDLMLCVIPSHLYEEVHVKDSQI